MVTGVSGALAASKIVDLGFSHVVIIPDSESAALFDALRVDSGHANSSPKVITPTREGEGIAIAAGLWVGGCKPLVILQNTGLMEGGDALRGCGVGSRIPLRLMVGWRGYAGATAGRTPMDSAYPYTEPILNAWRIPTWHLMGDPDIGVIEEMDRTAERTSLPAAVLTGYRFT